MELNKILQYNEILAKFMEGIFKEDAFSLLPLKEGEVWLPQHGLCNYTTLNYHKDWSWLMPVVEKIAAEPGIDVQIAHAVPHLPYSYFSIRVGNYSATHVVGKGENRYEDMRQAVFVGCSEYIEYARTKS